MTLSKEQLEAAYRALEEYNQILERRASRGAMGQQVRARPLDHIIASITDELYRLKDGPLTLAEAEASGKPFKRPGWNDYATALVDYDDEGYMCFVFVTNEWEPAYAEDILADDYELAEGGE